MADGPCAGVRAFISYSHADRDAASRLADWFLKAGGHPIWDAQLHPGARFRDDLLTFIGNAHIFVVLLTGTSMTRPWVLQEMGYAAALSIPIVPVSAGPLPEGLIGDLHALRVASDWANLEERLATVNWLRLKDMQVREPITVLATLARTSLERVKLLVDYAKRVKSFGSAGLLRQSAGFSTFSVPDAPSMHPIWIDHDGPTPRVADHHNAQREERQLFEYQARTDGCKLIIDPHLPYKDQKSKRTRLTTLRSFLTDPRTDERIQVIPHRRESSGNLTVCGDWWVAESLVPRPGGYRETTFTWHPSTVKRFSDNFDEEFAFLCQHNGVKPEQSRLLAIEEIDRALLTCV